MAEFIPVVAKMFSAISGNAADKHNAAVNERNAVLVRQSAKLDEDRLRRAGKRHIGGMKASIGASGVTISGSALDVIEDSAREIELDALTIRHRGEVEAAGFKSSASLDRARGVSKIIGGGLSAAGDLLSL